MTRRPPANLKADPVDALVAPATELRHDRPYDYPVVGAHLSAIASESVRSLVSEEEGQHIHMSWIPEDRVPQTHRAFVRRHTDRAARLLSLGAVAIRWFAPFNGSAGFWGQAPAADLLPVGVVPDDYHMTIALNAGIRGERVAAVIAHEVRHLAQRELVARLSHQVEREADADRFAAAYIEGEHDG